MEIYIIISGLRKIPKQIHTWICSTTKYICYFEQFLELSGSVCGTSPSLHTGSDNSGIRRYICDVFNVYWYVFIYKQGSCMDVCFIKIRENKVYSFNSSCKKEF